MQVPLYIIAQVLSSILASGTLCLMFEVTEDSYFGTLPVGSNIQALVFEIIISFLLMFVISGVATDNRAVSNFNLHHLSSFIFIFLNKIDTTSIYIHIQKLIILIHIFSCRIISLSLSIYIYTHSKVENFNDQIKSL